jgi:hypothetical protein
MPSYARVPVRAAGAVHLELFPDGFHAFLGYTPLFPGNGRSWTGPEIFDKVADDQEGGSDQKKLHKLAPIRIVGH